MKHRYAITVLLAMLCSSAPAYAAQCKALDGRQYSYTDPRCDPQLPKCSGNITHLAAQKKVDRSWLAELEKICPGAKINADGNILVFAGGNFHTFTLNSVRKKPAARASVNYVDQIVAACGTSSRQLECQTRETILTCNALNANESVACLKQMEAYHLKKAQELEPAKADAKRELELKLKAIENSAR